MQERTIMIGRRQFTAAGVMALLSGVTITVWGCGSTTSPSSPSSTTSDLSGTISANHGHSAVITAATLKSPTAVTLHIQGQATHDHTLDLTAAQVSAAAAGQQVSMTSSTTSGHNHVVTFN